MEDVISYPVGGNIFRAFSLKKGSGSELYRAWARRNFENIFIDVKTARSQEYYDNLVSYYSESLIKYWSSQVSNSDERLGFGPASKIFNLLIKAIQKSNEYSRKSIYPFMHVPFDKYSLMPLRNIINDISSVQYRVYIPSNATYSHGQVHLCMHT
jgi:hypothetical protein